MTGISTVLRTISQLLEDAGIVYMVVGSYASMVHGEPRTTYDLDLVIDPSASALDRLLASIDSNAYYLDADVAREAFRSRSMFNVIDMKTGWKVDLIIRKARPFSVEELRRRSVQRVVDIEVPTATSEDTIIAKLEWAKAGGSERQLRDVARIVAVQGDRLDRAYVERWVDDLGIRQEWLRVLSQLGL
jgi:hypothetical protein